MWDATDVATDGDSKEFLRARVARLMRMVSGGGGVAVTGCAAGPEVGWGSLYGLPSLGEPLHARCDARSTEPSPSAPRVRILTLNRCI